MSSREDDLITKFILDGALEVAGVDSGNGELLYMITPKMKDIMPDLYREHLDTVNKEMLNLWEKGYLDIDFMINDPIVTVSEKGLNTEEVSKLSDREIWALEEVKRLIRKQL